MKQLFQTLDKIKNKPGMYLGKKDLNRLSFFISTYIFTVKERTGENIPFIHQFSIYINYEYQTGIVDSNQWWDRIISQNRSQEEAFDLFYDHLERFKILLQTPEIFDVMERENSDRIKKDFDRWMAES